MVYNVSPFFKASTKEQLCQANYTMENPDYAIKVIQILILNLVNKEKRFKNKVLGSAHQCCGSGQTLTGSGSYLVSICRCFIKVRKLHNCFY